MDALTLLAKDHREVEKLFKRFERTDSGAEKKKIVAEVIRELSKHAVIEEQFLYPAIRERGGKKAELALEGLEEHHVVKWLLSELDGRSVKDERFDPKMKVLMENVRHHVEEEEEELFALVRRTFTPHELEDLGTLMEEAKRFAPTHPHPRSPDTPPGNFIAGAVASLIDRGRDLIAGVTETNKGTKAATGSRRAPQQLAAKRASRGGRQKK